MDHGLLGWSLQPNISTVAHLLAYMTGLVNQELLLQNEYLLAENCILKAHLQPGFRLSRPERTTLAEIGKRLGRKLLHQVTRIAKPDTILGWYRQLVAAKFDGSRQRRRPGRPPVSAEIENLVVRLARENSGWGYDRIVGALANLGHSVSDQTVGNILRRNGIAPAPQRKLTTTWKEFIRSHMAVLGGNGFLHSAAALLLDLQQAGGELLQLLFCLFDGSDVAVGLVLEVFGVSQADPGHQGAEQYAQSKHQEQAFRGAASGAGELPFAVFQHTLVGGGDLDECVVQSAAARHNFALDKSDLRFIAGVEHGLREMDSDAPEFVEALAQGGYHLSVERHALQKAKGDFVLLLQALQLQNQLAALLGCVLDEKLAHVVTRQPEVAAQCAERLLLFDKVPVDLQMLARDADLNAVGLNGRQHEHGDHSTVSGTQYAALTPTGSH
jgi:hypothetical protein